MNAGIEEADSESFEIVTAGQVVDLASGFHGEAQAFQARKETLDAETARESPAPVWLLPVTMPPPAMK